MPQDSDCSVRCGRFSLVFFNTIFCLFGLAVGCVGLWCLSGEGWYILQALVPPNGVSPNTQPTHFTPTLQQLAHSLMAVGCGVVMTSTVGCWAAITRGRCCLGVYLMLVVGLLVGEVCVGGLGVVYQGRVLSGLVGVLRARQAAHYGGPAHREFTNAFDFVQHQLQCCGVQNASEWADTRWHTEGVGGYYGRVGGSGAVGGQRAVPLTCCVLQPGPLAHLNPRPLNEAHCQSPPAAPHRPMRHAKGCLERVRMWVQAESSLIIGCGIGLGIVQLAGLLAGASLCRRGGAKSSPP